MMFRKLRNHLVLINIFITTIVLVIAFTTIYVVAQSSTAKRPLPRVSREFSQQEMQIISERMHDERRAALNSLLVSLIVVGVLVEIAVVMVSYYLAEVAIKPIREAYEAQKIFIANASHEIKTPLAAIAANLEAAEIQDNRWIDNIHKEVQVLTTMNQELLELARVDGVETYTEDKKTVDMNKMFTEITAEFEPKIREKKLKVSVVPKNEKVEVVVADLRQILIILLDNAVKYSNKKINLKYHEREITVSNDGSTIAKDDLGHVFERFYQVDKSAEGSGLGLAIAKALAERNDWDLNIESNEKVTQARLRIK